MTGTLPAQDGKDCAGHVHNPPEIGINLTFEFLCRHLLECTGKAIPGVVHRNINAAKALIAAATADSASFGDVTSSLAVRIWSPYVSTRSANCSGRRAVATT